MHACISTAGYYFKFTAVSIIFLFSFCFRFLFVVLLLLLFSSPLYSGDKQREHPKIDTHGKVMCVIIIFEACRVIF